MGKRSFGFNCVVNYPSISDLDSLGSGSCSSFARALDKTKALVALVFVFRVGLGHVSF